VARSGSEGFTLIEVLVAFTLLSLVLAITFGGLRLGARAWQSGEEAVERVEEFHTTYALLRRFVARAYPLTWGDALADRRFAFVGEEDSFSFVALFPSYPSLPGPQLVTVETEESDEGESLRLRWKPFEPDEDETRDADPVEDRILFRVNTKARQEFRFWLTRRYTRILWDSLSKLVADRDDLESPAEPESEEEPPPLKDSLAESAKTEMKHHEVVSQSDFETAYQESTYLPLGEEPLLLFSVGIKPNPDGPPILCMHPEKGQGLEMAMNDQILHSFCKLIIDSTGKAEWNLDLKFAPGGEESDDQPGGLN